MFIDCKNITYQYPEAEGPVFANLSFCFKRPGFHALFGPSGVGKTSFAKILCGQILEFDGELKLAKGVILYSYNLERLPDWSPVRRHLDKVTLPGRQALLQELIGSFGLEEVMEKRFSQLSLGQKNRINLVRYLLQDFHTLIMDESLANVDEPTREIIILKMKSLFPDVCFLYISHNVMEVSKFCDDILVFRGAHKTPQTKAVKGCDHTFDAPFSQDAIDGSMLEIMNAL